MDERLIPRPVTVEQVYLAALLDELRALNKLLQDKEKPQPSSTELRESGGTKVYYPPKKGGKIR